MSAKILVADDSLTIQKVVGITLADTGYELEQCKNEKDLFDKIKVRRYDLILLDFNLADSKSGYDLAKEVLAISPGVNILVMLGTFDSVDEGQLEEIGVRDKIVKPFESSKFVEKCTELIESGSASVVSDDDEDEIETDDDDLEEKTEEISLNEDQDDSEEEDEETEFEEIRVDHSFDHSDDEDELGEKTEEIHLSRDEDDFNDDEDSEFDDDDEESVLEEGADYFKQDVDEDLINDSEGWVVDSPSQEDESLLENSGGLWEEEEVPVSDNTSALNNEIESWGMSVPGVIGASNDSSLFPPVIDESGVQMVTTASSVEEFDEDEEDIEDTMEVQVSDTTLEISRDGEEVRLPAGDDLDYPEMGGTTVGSLDESHEPKSKLVSLEDLAPDDSEDDEELDITDPLIESPSRDQLDMANEIESDVSPDEFWAVDDKELAEKELTISEYVEGAGANPDMVDMSDNLEVLENREVERHDKHAEEEHSHVHEQVVEVEIDKEEILASITESLKPMIEEMVRELCRDKVEQIAWEVIPDLAENLIKKEIRDISDSINS
ncbi:MAG: response regulator [Deltaproteobacteria bacterium]|nr:MAG: response regulator [Deltaproteobacteria bacterium]